MLEHVALNQTRFHTPGITPDGRGIVVGKLGALTFTTVDNLVRFFGILSDEMPLDDVLPTLKVQEVSTALRLREFLVLLNATSSYAMDRFARAARLLGGFAFTGSNKHFVKYRDNASPLGYDTAALSDGGEDFILYDEMVTHACTRLRDLPFSQLVFRLSLRKVPGGETEPAETLWLCVERGIAPALLKYFWRNRVAAAAASVTPTGRSELDAARGYFLVRAQRLPDRMLKLFTRLPGIEIHRPLGENFVVQSGYRHPLRLEACPTLFDKDRFYVFSGSRDRVDVLPTPPALVLGERLVQADFVLRSDHLLPASVATPTPLRVELRLVPSMNAPRRVTATLVGWQQAEWLKRMVFALTPTVLAGYRMAPVDVGLLCISPSGVDGLPIGDLLEEVAPSIFIPVGCEFLPRVSDAVLTEHVGGVAGRKVVFRRGAAQPYAVPDEAFEPLGRRLLGRLDIETRPRSGRLPPTPAPSEPALMNDPVGGLPLWGFRTGSPPDVD